MSRPRRCFYPTPGSLDSDIPGRIFLNYIRCVDVDARPEWPTEKACRALERGYGFPLLISLFFFAAGSIHLAAETTSIIRGPSPIHGLAITGAEIALSTLMLGLRDKGDQRRHWTLPHSGLPPELHLPMSKPGFTTQVLSLEASRRCMPRWKVLATHYGAITRIESERTQ